MVAISPSQEQQSDYIRLFTHLSHIVTQTADIQSISSQAVQVIVRVLHVESCSMMLLSQGESQLRMAASSRIPEELWDQIRIPLGESVAGKVAKTGNPILMAKTRKSKGVAGDRYKTDSFICMPLKNSQGHILGVINITDKTDGDTMTSLDLDTLQAVSHLIACAVENNRLWVRTHESRQQISHVLEELPIGMFAIDSQNILTICNAAARRHLLLQDALEGLVWSEAFPPEIQPHVSSALDELAHGRAWFMAEFEISGNGNGSSTRSVRLSAVLTGELASEGDSHVLFLIEDLQQVQELRELRRSDKLKSSFLSMISHELRTPLASMKGAIHLIDQMASPELHEKASRIFKILHRNSDRLSRLVNNILDVMELESDSLSLYRKKTSLVKLVSQLVEKLRSSELDKHIEWELNLDEGSQIEIYVDESRIGQIFDHLLENAVKFTPDKGKIVVDAFVRDGNWCMTVCNSGSVIDADFEEKIFNKFYQIDDTLTRVCGGTGLGLYLCREFARMHGGEVRLRREDSPLVCFELILPATTELM